MKYALIIDGVVKQVQPYFQDGFVEVDETVFCGMILQNGEFVKPPMSLEEARFHFEELTTNLIQSKVYEYNFINKTAFGNIHSCANYRFDTNYTHQPFCAKVWDWNVRLWDTVRAWQDTLTQIPTDDQWLEIVEEVEF